MLIADDSIAQSLREIVYEVFCIMSKGVILRPRLRSLDSASLAGTNLTLSFGRHCRL